MSEIRRTLRPLPALTLAVIVGGGLAVAGIYGMGGFAGKGTGQCAATLTRAKALQPHLKGEIAALVPMDRAISLAEIGFTAQDAERRTVAAWSGRLMLLNLWATWCAPCKAEMPDLDRLQAARGSADFEVVTVNVDTSAVSTEKRRKFLTDAGVTALTDYTDSTLGILKSLQSVGLTRGLPTTVLIDRGGCVLAAMNGPAPWSHADALALVDAAIALPRDGRAP